MENKTNKREMMKVFLALGLVLSLSLTLAFGVSNPYKAPDTRLKLSPGESKIIALNLQNQDTQSITVKATLTESIGLIATLVDKDPTYTILPKQEGVPVKLKIEIPSNATIGQIGKITVSFQEISPIAGGMVDVNTASDNSFEVDIVDKSPSSVESKTPLNLIIVISLVLVILIASICLIRKHNLKAKKKK